MNDTTQKIAEEAAIAFCNTHTHVTTVSAKEDLKQAFQSAIEKADLVWRETAEALLKEKEFRAAHASEPLKVSEIAICENCGTQQHDQIDHICTTCNRAELVNLVDILKQGRDWLKSRSALQPAHASEQ